MGTPRKLRTKADYLVIGGGMAGVAALAEARNLGISAICLEARGRIGGRIRTARNRRIAPYPLELGAEFVHGSFMKDLCERLGLTLHRHPSDGVAYVDGELHPLLPILHVLQDIRERAGALLAAGSADRPVEEFLASLKYREDQLPPGVTPHLLLQLIRNDFAARVSDLGLTGLLAPDVDGYENNFRVAEGYDEVPRRVAAESEVYCHHTVTAVVRHPDRVEVFTNRGVYSGNAVVVCLPVGVLQAGDVRFDPPLTHAKTAAIEAVTAGAATKLVLCFRRNRMGGTFWPKNVPLLATTLATQLWWPTGWGYEDHQRFVVSCLVGGAAVLRFAGPDPRQVGSTQLAHMFGRERVVGKLLAPYFAKSWHDDPCTRGGYSSLPVGTDHAALLRELEAPEDDENPQLFFAGEYVSPHPGSVHSAYQSGTAAVRRAAAARMI
jgi:monoamine oxidase